jgi:alpha-beta hydrolase superfamily lysophospholipase
VPKLGIFAPERQSGLWIRILCGTELSVNKNFGGRSTRGDIGYAGQLENDLEDLVAVVRKTSPNEPLTLLGHSAGGGFALRVASSPIQNLFARTVLLAPYLGYDAPTNRPSSGGWASADIPRIFACAASGSTAARRCRRWPSRYRQIPKRFWRPAIRTA